MALFHTLRQARHRSGLTMRALAARAGTSHSAVAAYEQGRTSPTLTTFERLVGAAGFAIDVTLERRVREHSGLDRGDELVEVLRLAEQFPGRHSPTLEAPAFGRRSDLPVGA